MRAHGTERWAVVTPVSDGPARWGVLNEVGPLSPSPLQNSWPQTLWCQPHASASASTHAYTATHWHWRMGVQEYYAMRDPLRAPWPTTFSASLRMPRSAGQSVQPRAVGVLCVCATRASVATARLLLSHGTHDSKQQAQRQLIAGTRSARVRRLMRPGRRPQPNGRRRCRRRRTSPTRAPIRSGGRKALRRNPPLRWGIPT